MVPFMAMSSHDRFVIETPLRPGSRQRERNKTFFFAGGICGSGRYTDVPPNCKHYKQQRYSGGVRQTVGAVLCVLIVHCVGLPNFGQVRKMKYSRLLKPPGPAPPPAACMLLSPTCFALAGVRELP